MSRHKSDGISGWCRHRGHYNCVVCECDCHVKVGVKVASRCGECGWRPAGGEGLDPETGRCLDPVECKTRVEANPTYQRYREYQAHGEQIRAERGEETAARNGRPTSGTCQCGCEEKTAGGRFRPGHDAKLKSRLKEAARGGDVQSYRELLDRGWAKPESDRVPPAVIEAA